MDVAITLFTRDLRVHDNPALARACTRARQVVPVFVVDPALTVPANRGRFLAQSLEGLRDGDAGMRQLAAEGFMHNRARMITASFLTRTLGLDWRHGYRHFAALLADGDVANNAGNWQWVAGTGNNTRPGRVLNPLRQARRFDPGGEYVRRYVPELAGLAGNRVHTPWQLPADERARLDYPGPLADLS